MGPQWAPIGRTAESVGEAVQGEARAFEGEMGEHRTPQRAIAPRVGVEEARAAPRANDLQQAAFHNRAVQPHELGHAAARARRRADLRAIEVDDQGLDLVLLGAEEEIPEMQVRMAGAGVVKASDGCAGGRGGVQRAAFAAGGISQELHTVLRPFDVKCPEGRAEERAPCPLADREDRLGNGCTGQLERGIDLELVQRTRETEELPSQCPAEPATVVKEPEM